MPACFGYEWTAAPSIPHGLHPILRASGLSKPKAEEIQIPAPALGRNIGLGCKTSRIAVVAKNKSYQNGSGKLLVSLKFAQ